jgi:GH35 family endo-1,4-beta-xylanase
MNTMPKIGRLKAFLSILTVVLINAGSIRAQLVTNGSFELSDTGQVSNTDVSGWVIQVSASISPAPVIRIVNDTVEQGNRAMSVQVSAVGSNPWDIQVVADSIPVVPGETYIYSIWAKASASGAQANLTVGNYSYQEYGYIRPATLTTSWQKYSITFTINDLQTFARAPIHFSISADTGKTIYIDNLQIINIADSGNVWNGPPLAYKQSKFVGNVYSVAQAPNFKSYWNQVIPENAGKWGSVEATRDVYNWTDLDNAYNLAKNNGFPFMFHVLVWGNQQPLFMSDADSLASMTPEQQLEQVTQWFDSVAGRYPDIDYLQVVNEPLHAPAPYRDALGGNGSTGWDWVINAFQLARNTFPAGTKLMINDYNIINSTLATSQYLNIIRLLQAQNLIDCIGVQGHAFTTTASSSTMKICLDSLGATGLPVFVTELDIDGPNDPVQLQDYQRIFPTLYEHPAVEGITLWGWRPGLWRDAQGAYIIMADGSERPALEWLRNYLDTLTTVSVAMSGSLPFENRLFNNYPNPFNPATTIEYSISKASNVSLVIFDALGRHVRTLVDGEQSAGRYTVSFNANDLSSGIYFYSLTAGNFHQVKKLLLVK